jgi:hypothetical protein
MPEVELSDRGCSGAPLPDHEQAPFCDQAIVGRKARVTWRILPLLCPTSTRQFDCIAVLRDVRGEGALRMCTRVVK